jgi:hypothetical protein
MEAEDLAGLAESEVITIRDDEDHLYYEPDEDDDAWHRARRGRYADDEAIESDAMDLQRAGGHSTDMDVDGAHKRPVVDQQPSVDGRGGTHSVQIPAILPLLADGSHIRMRWWVVS